MGKKLTLPNILFWCLAGLSAVMLVAMVLVVGGFVPLESASEPVGASTEALPGPAPKLSTASTETATTTDRTTTPAESTTPAETETSTTTGPAEEPGPTLVVVTAARGASWFSARLGSENGRLLDERVLAQGESTRFVGKRIWLSIGAAGNVDVTVDGKPWALAAGTVSVVLTRSGATDADS